MASDPVNTGVERESDTEVTVDFALDSGTLQLLEEGSVPPSKNAVEDYA